MSYIIETNRPTDPAVVAQFKAALKATADRAVEYLNGDAYPVGTPAKSELVRYNFHQGAYVQRTVRLSVSDAVGPDGGTEVY